jgi:N-acetylneuraminic acid mutarotase
MSKIAALLYLTAFLMTLCIISITPVFASAGSWVSKASMEESRAYLGVAVVNGKIYAIGGDIGSDVGNASPGTTRTSNVANTTEEYNPATDLWILKASMPTSRAGFGIAVYKNMIYCIGGWTYTNDYLNTGVNEVYDPATDTWETKTPMFTTNALLTANVVNGRIHVFPLFDDSIHEVYDPATDSWTTKTPPPYPITSSASAVVDNKIYFIGRRDSSGSGTVDRFILIYDAISDSWNIGSSSPTYGFSATGGATSGVNAPKRIYFFDETATYVYDPECNTWTSGAPTPTARLCAKAIVINDEFYVVGGRTGQHGYITLMSPSAINEKYTPIDYGTPDPSYVAPTDSTAPKITVLSPENRTYYTTSISLNFTVDEPSSWMRYKLDAKNVSEITENITLTDLSCGKHNITFYATDVAGNTGTSKTIYFTIKEPTPFPTTLVAAAAVTVAAIGVCVLVYFKKRKH